VNRVGIPTWKREKQRVCVRLDFRRLAGGCVWCAVVACIGGGQGGPALRASMLIQIREISEIGPRGTFM
jgi:hypothetical protein